MKSGSVLVVGGGAAGYFAAITAGEATKGRQVVLSESGTRPLRKVEISGGGRCNVTHHCYDPREFSKAYPRGEKELSSAFSRFQAEDTVSWFESRGVKLKAEEDGRMFPVTDSSETIISCLETAREKAGVQLLLQTKATRIERLSDNAPRFQVTIKSPHEQSSIEFDAVILTTGSTPTGYQIARSLGHQIEECVPSLFTFEVPDSRLQDLSGISVSEAALTLRIPGEKDLKEKGPLLVTHWGLSGPSVLRLSAWGAPQLAHHNYQAELLVDWAPQRNHEELTVRISEHKERFSKRQVTSDPAVVLPKRLWQNLTQACSVKNDTTWHSLNKTQLRQLVQMLKSSSFRITGKGVFKEEFVTCGGVSLSEVDFRTMESKLCSGLYFAGEILNIDGITGGYNFQSAWTTGWIAGKSV